MSRHDKSRARFGAAYRANHPTIVWVSISLNTIKMVEAIKQVREAMLGYSFKFISFTPKETP